MSGFVSRLRIAVDSRGAERNVRSMDRALDGLTGAGREAATQTALLDKSLKRAGAAAAGFAAAFGAGRITSDLATLQGINSRLSALTGDLASQQKFLKTTAKELSAEYVTLAGGYSRLLPLYKAGVLSLEQARIVTKGLANVQAETGASSADLGRSIFGLAQGLSAGTLRAEELNQVTEALPGLLQELDKAAGLAGGGFRQLVIDGEVTSSFFRDTLITALDAYDGAAAKLAGNIDQTFNRTRNSYTRAVEAFDQPISSALVPLAEGLSVALDKVAENAEDITDAATLAGKAVALLVAGQAAGKAAKFASDLGARAKAFSALAVSEGGYAKAARASAVAQAESAAAATLSAKASTANATASEAATAAKARSAKASAGLSTAQRQAQAATDGLTASQAAGVQTANAYAAAQANAVATSAALQASQTAAAAAQGGNALATTASGLAASTRAVQGNALALTDARSATARYLASQRDVDSTLTAVAASMRETSKAARLKATLLGGVGVAAGKASVALQGFKIASAASGVAARGLLALIGGLPGAFALAGIGLAQYALQQTEAERATEGFKKTIAGLSDAYIANADAARDSARATEVAIRGSIREVEAQLAALTFQSRQASGITAPIERVIKSFGISEQAETLKALRTELVGLLEEQQRLEDEFAQVVFTSGPDQARTDLAGQAATRAASIAETRRLIEAQFPDDAKIAELETKKARIQAAVRDSLVTGDAGVDRANAAVESLNAKIAELTGEAKRRETANREAERAAQERQRVIDEALPDQARQREYVDQVRQLTAAHADGELSAEQFGQGVSNLADAYRELRASDTADKVRELTDALDRRIDSPIAGFTTDLALFQRALAETPEKAAQIQIALSRLDLEARATLTVVEDSDNAATLATSYRKIAEAQADWHAARGTAEEQANADALALAQDYAEKATRVYQDATRPIVDFLASADRGSSFQFGRGRSASAGVELDAERERAEQAARELTDAQARTSSLSAIEAAYQARVTELVRSGEATRDQARKASTADQLSGLVSKYEAEIDLATSLVQGVLALDAQKQEAQANAALSNARNLEREADEAERVYERSGTEQNRIAAEQARERADIAEAGARREFEQQKKAQLQMARISQGLAIVNAYASGGNFYTGLALATVAYLKTQQTIDQIKAQQFNGGSDISASSGGASGGNTSVNSGNTNGASDQPQQVSVIVMGGYFTAASREEMVGDAIRRLSEDGTIADVNGQPFDTRNVRQIEIRE